jgi:hypothetical protein
LGEASSGTPALADSPQQCSRCKMQLGERSSLQDVVSSNMRATAVALTSVLRSIVGSGFGPALVALGSGRPGAGLPNPLTAPISLVARIRGAGGGCAERQSRPGSQACLYFSQYSDGGTLGFPRK